MGVSAGEGRPWSKRVRPTSRKEPEDAQALHLPLCVHPYGVGDPHLSVPFDPQGHPAKQEGRPQPPDDETMAQRCLGTSPRTHSTQAEVTQHFLCRVGETEAQSGAETSQGYTARTQITGKS